MAGLQVAPSSGGRACSATTLAPAFQQRTTSSAISWGWVGRCGFCDLWAMPPVGAMVTMTLRLDMLSPWRGDAAWWSAGRAHSVIATTFGLRFFAVRGRGCYGGGPHHAPRPPARRHFLAG